MECDYISELPDSLLTQILLNLPTKGSVQTSVLSKRWRNLWLNVPGLELGPLDFPCEEVLATFLDRFTEFNLGSQLQKFDIMYKNFNGYQGRFMELLGTVVDRGIQHLDVSINHCIRYDFMRQNIYKSKTLVSLKLESVQLRNPEFVVSLPCLKIMRLCNISYGKDGPLVVEKLISGCPVLEDLELISPFYILSREVLMFLRMTSQTLKSRHLYFDSWSGTDFSLEIDAPRLKYMSLEHIQSDSIVVKNLSSLSRINIVSHCCPFRPVDFSTFCDFLTGISTSVRHMIIRLWSLERLYPYSKLGQIPKFHNLIHLQASFSSSLLLLRGFLERCPNLKNLILDFLDSLELWQIYFTNVPQCLISTLEYVEIKNRR